MPKNFRIYTCDGCGKTHNTMIDRKPHGWFKLKHKYYYGCDKHNTHENEVCSITCTATILKKQEHAKCLNWAKLDTLCF